MENMDDKVKLVADLLRGSSCTVALTGAGVSTESGIPDFRSPGSGLWAGVNPEVFTIQGFKADPAQFYNLGLNFFQLIAEAQPNDTHIVLGELQRRGLVKAIITQNVDGLHQKGGADRVLEIHGTLSSASCVFCGTRVPGEEVSAALAEGILPPLCPECGEPVKPDVILFGEAMPPAYREALDEARQADCIMVIGSSMQVSPANMIPNFCENLVIINHGQTFYDSRARVVIHDSTARVMRRILDELDRE